MKIYIVKNVNILETSLENELNQCVADGLEIFQILSTGTAISQIVCYREEPDNSEGIESNKEG